MKKVLFIIICMLSVLVGCGGIEEEVLNKKIFNDFSYNDSEIIVTKYTTSTNEYICKYRLIGDEIKLLYDFITVFEGRSKTLRSDDDLNKYYFKIGEKECIISNIICEVNGKIYRINYDVDAFFDTFIVLNKDKYNTINDVIEVESINKIVLSKYTGVLKELFYFNTSSKIESFYDYLNSIVLFECSLAKGIKAYDILINDINVEIFKLENIFYFMVNDKIYYTNDLLAFLDQYNKNNTDKNITNQLPWVELNDSYMLVTDANDLNINDKIVIVSSESDYALSTTQNIDNRGSAAITKDGSLVTLNSNVQIITLERGSVDETYAFKVDGGYLYVDSSDAENLKTQEKIDKNASFAISISSDAVTIKVVGDSTHNLLKYNDSSNVFSCYNEDKEQKNVCIYKCADCEEILGFDQAINAIQNVDTLKSLNVYYNKSEELLDTIKYNYTFEEKVIESNNSIIKLGDLSWNFLGTLKSEEYFGDIDNTKGFQLGSGSKPFSAIVLKTTNELSNVISIKINTSGASEINATLKIKVGGVEVYKTNLTSFSTEYKIENLANSGEVSFEYEQTSSKAIYIKSIEIVQSTVNLNYDIQKLNLRFSTYFSKEIYDNIVDNATSISWGIEYIYGDNCDWSNGKKTICNIVRVANGGDSEVDETGDYYQFAILISLKNASNLDLNFIARAYVLVDGVTYYMNESSTSVKSLAQYYLEQEETSLYLEHIGVLEHIADYVVKKN